MQARFTEALMKDKANVDFSADRILSTAETGQPKSEVLKQLQQRHAGTTYHFVEDKMGTLDKVCSTPLMHAHQLCITSTGRLLISGVAHAALPSLKFASGQN